MVEGENVTAVVVEDCASTATDTADEVDAMLYVSPLYTAWTLYLPGAMSAEKEIDPVPLFSVIVPTVVLPANKVTLPDGTVTPFGLTVTANVVVPPSIVGLGETFNAVVVAICAGRSVTVNGLVCDEA
jgi:hypothetical protein